MKLYSPAVVKEITTKYRFRFQKNLGQNFLVDGNIVQKIVDAAEITEEDLVLEIGAGIGTLTQAIAEKAKKVVVVEIDKSLAPILKETLAGHDNIEIIYANALKTDFDSLVAEITQGEFGAEGKAYKIVANLPYYITTPLIMHALESKFHLNKLVIMVQKEVADRLTASAGSKDYGAITVAVQYYSQAKMAVKVPKTVFIPQPEVESAVVCLDVLKQPPVEISNEKIFFQVVKAAFGQRRKTLLNAISGLVGSKENAREVLVNCEVDPQRRGETLSIEEFSSITNMILALSIRE